MPGRRTRIPNVYNVNVPVEVARHAAGAQHLLAALMQHLLFSREQCHAPLANLRALLQASRQREEQRGQQAGRRPRVKTWQRKANKFCSKLEAMLQLCDGIPFPELGSQSVLLLLGASVLRPREVYCVNLPAAMEPAGAAPPSDKALAEASRKLMRSLIMQHGCISEWDGAPGPTKLFLLFQAEQGALAAAPQGFTAKRAFSINLRKAFQVNINLSERLGDPVMQQQQHYQQQQQQLLLHPVAAEAAAGDAMGLEQLEQQMSARMSLGDSPGAAGPGPGGCVPPPVWYQCGVFIKGLKPPTAAV